MHKVLIVGRPNVGKSSLFNRLVRRRESLVVNYPGVTRDILKQKVSWWGVDFEVWDSGGLWSAESQFGSLINKKVKKAIGDSDLVLFVMDARSGLMEEDKKTFHLVKKSGKPFLALVNKVDKLEQSELLLSDFYRMGIELFPCAFEKDRGVSEIVEWILYNNKNMCKNINPSSVTANISPNICLLLAGKTNAGKSTLYNALLKQDRALISSVAGTTMDVIKDQFQYRGKTYALLDTAGIGSSVKKNKKTESLAKWKTQQSFKKADLIMLLVDAVTGPGRQEARLLDFCIEEHKAVILVINKWDLIVKQGNKTKAEYKKNIQDRFRFYSHLPIVVISALNISGLGVLMKKVDEIYEKLNFRITTSELNRFFMEVIRKAPSPVYGVQDVKFYYLTQTHQTPPTFVAFANYPKGVRDSYRRFLVRQIQNKWNLKGIPIRIFVLPR